MDETSGVKPEDFPASGITPSVNSRRVLNLATQVLCVSLVTVFFVIRCLTKRMNRQPITLEDGKTGFPFADMGSVSMIAYLGLTEPLPVTCAIAWVYIAAHLRIPESRIVTMARR